MNKLQHEEIQYIEFFSDDFDRIKDFYTRAFDWQFTDYGPHYVGFECEYVDGGFAKGTPQQGSVVVILYSNDLEKTRDKVVAAGGEITKDIYDFPGTLGRF